MSEGLYLMGGFLSMRELAPYTSREGEEVTPCRVMVMDNGYTVAVEFRSAVDALEALGGAEPEVMTPVTLPVRAQGAWDKEAGRFGRVRLRGRSEG